MKPKVCFLTAIASKYKMELWGLISEEVDLTIVLKDVASTHRHESFYDYHAGSANIVYLKEDYKGVLEECAKTHDILVDSVYTTKEGRYAVGIFKKYHKKTVLIADGGLPIKRNFLMEKIISYFMNRHDYFFSSGSITDQYFTYYGVPQEKIYHYQQSSLKKSDMVHNKQLHEAKLELRKKYQIPEDEFIFLSIGRPVPRKGFDILVKAFHQSGCEDKSKLYIISESVEENVQALIDKYHIPNIKFISLLSDEELKEHYALADVFILPTRYDIWGLVINEAMSFGLPVITSDKCVAGMHFKALNDSVIVVENENVEAYAEAMKNLFENASLRKEKESLSFEIIQTNTVENGAKDLINHLKEIV